MNHVSSISQALETVPLGRTGMPITRVGSGAQTSDGNHLPPDRHLQDGIGRPGGR
jgi:hypothetical protein